MNLKTTLLGELVTRAADPVKPGKGRPLYRVVAVWMSDRDGQPAVTLAPVNAFGRPIPGMLISCGISTLVIP